MQPRLDIGLFFSKPIQFWEVRHNTQDLCVNFIAFYYILISAGRYADIMYDMVTKIQKQLQEMERLKVMLDVIGYSSLLSAAAKNSDLLRCESCWWHLSKE